MQYRRISADCHLDLPWLPPDLFVSEAPRELKDRMPYVADGPDGPQWTTKNGVDIRHRRRRRPGRRASSFPGSNYRVDMMAETGLYEDGKKGIRRPGDPHLRIKDMDRDGVDAEVIYGILGAATRLERPRGGQRDAAHLQRLAEGVLQPLSRPPDRPRLPALRRHRRRGEGGPSRRQDRAARASSCRARGTWSRCGTRCGSRCGRRSTTCSCRCTSTPSRRCRRERARAAAGQLRPRGALHRRLRLPDEPGQHPGRDHRRRRARALSEPAHRASARAASAGSPTRSTAWTSSGRTASATSGSR